MGVVVSLFVSFVVGVFGLVFVFVESVGERGGT